MNPFVGSKEWRDAIQEIRLGQLRNAVAIIGATVAAAYSKEMPLYSDGLNLTVEQRRSEVAVVLKCVGRELEKLENELTKGN